MTHASTNPPWQDYPSTATLVTAAKLEKIEGTADALRASQYGSIARTRWPMLAVYTSATWSIPAVTDAWVNSGITWTVFRDTDGGWTHNATASYYTIPLSGRLWDLYWQPFSPSVTNGGVLACKIALNGVSVGINSIVSDSRRGSGSECTPYAYRQGTPLNAGDRLYFNVWCTNAVNVAPGFGINPNILIRDAGPQ